MLPARLLLRDELLPLRRVDNEIEIATSRLFATQGLDGLKALTGLRLRPVLWYKSTNGALIVLSA